MRENLDKLTPQLQLRKKLTEQEYLYASAGMSYTMPTFRQTGVVTGSNVIGNPDLKPQTGTHYEMGWKKNYDEHGLRIALFKYNIEDQITATSSGVGTWSYENEDNKNTGLEAEYSYNGVDDSWNYNVGFTIGDPKTKNSKRPSGRSQYWERAYDRYQINGGVGYKEGNWAVNLLSKYVFGRTKSSLDSAAYGPEKSKPALYTTLHINYKINDVQEVYLKAENLFDRKDIINNSSSEYYYTPFNFVIGYNVKL